MVAWFVVAFTEFGWLKILLVPVLITVGCVAMLVYSIYELIQYTKTPKVRYVFNEQGISVIQEKGKKETWTKEFFSWENVIQVKRTGTSNYSLITINFNNREDLKIHSDQYTTLGGMEIWWILKEDILDKIGVEGISIDVLGNVES